MYVMLTNSPIRPASPTSDASFAIRSPSVFPVRTGPFARRSHVRACSGPLIFGGCSSAVLVLVEARLYAHVVRMRIVYLRLAEARAAYRRLKPCRWWRGASQQERSHEC